MGFVLSNESGPWMVWRFQGRYDSRVDTKGRWSLPAGLKSEDLSASPLIFTVARDHGLPHLDVYAPSEWQDLVERVSAMASFRPEVQAFKRFYLSSGINVAPDKLGRYLLPKSLRAHADIESAVVAVGMGDKIEIWSKDHWEKAFQELSSQSESIMATLSRGPDDKGER
jgi:MraZ protein